MKYLSPLLIPFLAIGIAHATPICPSVADLASIQITDSAQDPPGSKSPWYIVHGQLTTADRAWDVSTRIWAHSEAQAIYKLRDALDAQNVITFDKVEASACQYSMPIQDIWFFSETTITLT